MELNENKFSQLIKDMVASGYPDYEFLSQSEVEQCLGCGVEEYFGYPYTQGRTYSNKEIFD